MVQFYGEKERYIVADWKNAEIVSLPKKGDLQRCDNRRGISLLDVLVARIIQERLQVISEKVLPESQCGFRKGRGCCDMIFVAWQLLEKAREHQNCLFTLFIDCGRPMTLFPERHYGRCWKSVGYLPGC